MLDLTPEQRQLLVDKLPDAANVLLGALVVAPFLGQAGLSAGRAVSGIALWLLTFGVCFYLGRKK